MGRTAKHNWKNLFLEFNQGRYKSARQYAEAKGLNYDRLKKEFKKLQVQGQNEGKKGQNLGAKKTPPKEKGTIDHPWEKLKKQFTDWPEEKLQAYLIQLEARKAELEAIPFEELIPEEIKELGRVRQERRAILSDPDPERRCSAHNRDGSQCRNRAERGKKVCWNHGGAPGSGGQPGSKNALKTGEYETIWIDALDEEERILLLGINTDPLNQVDEEIRLLTIRERRMMQRIQALKIGLTEKQRRVLQERKTVKEAITVHDDITGQTKIVTVPREQLVVSEVEETEYRTIDDIIRLEEALTRVQEKKVKAIKTKYDLMGEDERRMRIEKMRQEIEIARERMDLEKSKVVGGPEDTTDDGFIDALQGKAGEAWDGFTEED